MSSSGRYHSPQIEYFQMNGCAPGLRFNKEAPNKSELYWNQERRETLEVGHKKNSSSFEEVCFCLELLRREKASDLSGKDNLHKFQFRT